MNKQKNRKSEQKITIVGNDVEKLESLYTVGRNILWCIHYRKQCGDSSKQDKTKQNKTKQNKTELQYDPAITLLGI